MKPLPEDPVVVEFLQTGKKFVSKDRCMELGLMGGKSGGTWEVKVPEELEVGQDHCDGHASRHYAVFLRWRQTAPDGARDTV